LEDPPSLAVFNLAAEGEAGGQHSPAALVRQDIIGPSRIDPS